MLALALYKTPGVNPDKNDPKIREVSSIIGRTPSAVALKLANLRAVESAGKSGLTHVAPMDKLVWKEFEGRDESLFQEADRVRREYSRRREPR